MNTSRLVDVYLCPPDFVTFLFISLYEEQGKKAIYYAIDKKITSSLEEFVERIVKGSDYFIEEI